MPGLEGLRVVRSKIHGYGIIALRKFNVGDKLVYGDGVLYRESDEFDDTYSLIMPGYEPSEDPDDDDEDGEGPPLYYDLVDQTRWINHSCEPNTEIDSSWNAEQKQITAWWVATRNIEVGDELTYDYAFSGHLAEVCHCGAPGCRGLIVDDSDDELHEIPEKLIGHLSPQLRARL